MHLFVVPQTYAAQLKSVEVQYGRVMSFGEELVGNPHVGGGVAIKQEIEELRMKFEPLKDNVVDSLELLKRSEQLESAYNIQLVMIIVIVHVASSPGSLDFSILYCKKLD